MTRSVTREGRPSGRPFFVQFPSGDHRGRILTLKRLGGFGRGKTEIGFVVSIEIRRGNIDNRKSLSPFSPHDDDTAQRVAVHPKLIGDLASLIDFDCGEFIGG